MSFKIKDGLSLGANTILDASGNLTVPGKTTLSNTTTAGSSLNLGTGTADPTSPVTGDLWNNTGILKIRQAAITKTIAYTDSTITGNAANVTGTVAIANGGTNGSATPTAGAVPYGTGTAFGFTAAGTSGQYLTSAGAGVPTWTTFTLPQSLATSSNPQFNSIGVGVAAGGTAGTITGIEFTGNSATVTNGVYTTSTQTISGSKTFTASTGIILSTTAPVIQFVETDQTLPAGKIRVVCDGGNFRIDRNTAVAGDYSTYTSDLTISSAGATAFSNSNVSITAAGAITGTSFNSITGLSLTATAPLVAGTATGGSSTLVSRQDHVHPVQTSVSGSSGSCTGNAATATSATSATSADSATTFTSTTQNSRFNSIGVNTAASGTAGEIRATNNITAYYSDDRLKVRIGNIDNALEKLLSLNGFYYHANETAQALGYTVQSEVGVSAQEVQAILPEVVVPAPIDEKYLTVRYEKLVPLLIEAIKDLNAKVNSLEAELKRV